MSLCGALLLACGSSPGAKSGAPDADAEPAAGSQRGDGETTPVDTEGTSSSGGTERADATSLPESEDTAAIGGSSNADAPSKSDADGGSDAVPHGADSGSSDSGTASAAGSPDPEVTTDVSDDAALDRPDADTSGSGSLGELPGLSSFTSFTVRTLSTPPTGPSRPCDTASWSFDRAAQTLTWNFCTGDSTEPEQGGLSLSDAEARSVTNTLSMPRLTDEATCFSDTLYIELELERDGQSTLYQTDHWCGPLPSDAKLVRSLHYVVTVVEWLSFDYQLPPTPSTLTLSTGEVVPSLAPDLCIAGPRRHRLDLATGSVSWDLCMADPDTGERAVQLHSSALDPTQLSSVLDAYAELELGASEPCTGLEAPKSLDVINGSIASLTIDDDLELLDETGSCYYGGRGAGFAIGVAALAHLVDSFVDAP